MTRNSQKGKSMVNKEEDLFRHFLQGFDGCLSITWLQHGFMSSSFSASHPRYPMPDVGEERSWLAVTFNPACIVRCGAKINQNTPSTRWRGDVGVMNARGHCA